MASEVNYNNFLIFNPEGKIKQLEYIRSTTELGNTVVGLRNSKYGVFIAHCEKRSKLSYNQKKIFKINKNTLFTFSGITNDGLNIVDYLIDECVNEEIIKGRNIHHLDVFDDLCYDASIRTLSGENRLFGVSGLLMTFNDGVRLVEFDPRGFVKEVKAMSIGNRSQSCKTILEAHSPNFESIGIEDLINVGILALKNAHPEDGVLKGDNVEIWIVEGNEDLYTIEVEPFLN